MFLRINDSVSVFDAFTCRTSMFLCSLCLSGVDKRPCQRYELSSTGSKHRSKGIPSKDYVRCFSMYICLSCKAWYLYLSALLWHENISLTLPFDAALLWMLLRSFKTPKIFISVVVSKSFGWNVVVSCKTRVATTFLKPCGLEFCLVSLVSF